MVVGAAHALAQLDTGADPELGERIAQMGSHGVRGKVQLCGDVAVGRARRDEVTTVSSESVRLFQPVLARGWLTMRRCTPNRRNSRPTRRASARASWPM